MAPCSRRDMLVRLELVGFRERPGQGGGGKGGRGAGQERRGDGWGEEERRGIRRGERGAELECRRGEGVGGEKRRGEKEERGEESTG